MENDSPFSEFHSRKSRKKLPHSQPDTNGVVECLRCRGRFPDMENLWAHASLRLTVGIRQAHSPVWLAGRWIHREQYGGERGVGFFQCCRCTKERNAVVTWYSFYSYKEYGQGCRVCNDKKWINAMFFWENQNRVDGQKRGTKLYLGHRKELCEACELGVCVYVSQ